MKTYKTKNNSEKLNESKEKYSKEFYVSYVQNTVCKEKYFPTKKEKRNEFLKKAHSQLLHQ